MFILGPPENVVKHLNSFITLLALLDLHKHSQQVLQSAVSFHLPSDVTAVTLVIWPVDEDICHLWEQQSEPAECEKLIPESRCCSPPETQKTSSSGDSTCLLNRLWHVKSVVWPFKSMPCCAYGDLLKCVFEFPLLPRQPQCERPQVRGHRVVIILCFA